MSKFFGKTWWGQNWLNALGNIDYSNRLPRGSSYARNGSITSLSIEGNIIKAKVQGSRPRPYNVSVVVPAFTETDVKLLTKAIAQKPVIVSKLLNRELDPELLQIAQRIGLNVFPRQWDDFDMNCSCPDYAVPCKHLAAVIYKISAEIDNNPFLVFDLHRVNLEEELKKEKIFITQTGSEIPTLKGLLFPESTTVKKDAVKKASIRTGTAKKTATSPPAPASFTNTSLNYAALTPIHDPLIQLLPDEPAFYQGSGNFREKYAAVLRKVVRNAQRMITGKEEINAFLPPTFTAKAKQRNVATGLEVIGFHTNIGLSISCNNVITVHVDEQPANILVSQLITLLWQIPVPRLADYQPSVAALRNSLLLALNLVANGAIVPQLVQLENKTFTIRLLPALNSKPVKALVEKMEEMLPPDMLFLAGKPPVAIEKAAVVALVSVWMDALVQALSETDSNDIFIQFFFSNYVYAFNAPGQQALPGGIQAWLQRFYLAQGKYRPAIMVEEVKDDSFLVTICITEKEKPLEKAVMLRDILTLKKYEQQRFEILQSLAQLSSFVPGLDDYINTKGEALMTMSIAGFTPFLMQAIPAIQLLDIDILLPKSLQEILQPKASIRIKQKSKDGKTFLRLDELLDFDWQVAVGDELLDETAFRQLLKRSEGLIKYKNRYLYVSPGDLEKLHKHFASTKELSAFEMLRAALADDYYGAAVTLTEEVKDLIKQLTELSDVPLPAGITATLRPYQHRGFSWMYRNGQIGFGSVIADDMGLGKTLQVIATLAKYKEEGALQNNKALVIAPTGLLTNWLAEFEKFAPGMQVQLYHGSNRQLDKKAPYDVLLTSYGTARSDADKLKKTKWHAVITDEAQNIKNQDTAQSKAIKGIPAHTFIAMSGTPVENRLSELWSIMDFCNRGFLGSLSQFKQTFATPIQNQNDASAAEKLKIVTAPFLMRRLKSDKSIISDLPDKIEIDSFSQLVPAQASLYQKTLHKAMEVIEEVKATDQKSLFERQGLVLQMILALKQICNHPTQFLKNKVLDASLSGKISLLFDKLDSMVENGEKVLIFTQFTEMAKLLQHFITERFGEIPVFYHGGCTLKQRKEMVDRFQTNRADKIFLLSLKAAGTGLNLTAANHVIHYDLWWNPAVEAQATDRAYRIGQKSNVMVHRFITKGTFEERINEMIQSKKALADMTVATGENWIGNRSNQELKALFELG